MAVHVGKLGTQRLRQENFKSKSAWVTKRDCILERAQLSRRRREGMKGRREERRVERRERERKSERGERKWGSKLAFTYFVVV